MGVTSVVTYTFSIGPILGSPSSRYGTWDLCRLGRVHLIKKLIEHGKERAVQHVCQLNCDLYCP